MSVLHGLCTQARAIGWLEFLITFVGSVVLCCFMQPAGHRTSHPVTFQPLADASAKCTARAPCNAVEWFDVLYASVFSVTIAARAWVPLNRAWAAGRLQLLPRSLLWCIDLTVVISSFIAVFAVPELRAILTLRLWQLAGRIRGTRTLLQVITRTGAVSKMVMLAALFVGFFAQVGVALFAGGMRHACHLYDAASDEWADTGDACDTGCARTALGELQGCAFLGAQSDTSHATTWWKQTYTCEPGMQCRCGFSSEADASCTFHDNPNYGMTSFDSMPWALVTMYAAFTLEGWVDTMNDVVDSTSMLAIPVFLLLATVGIFASSLGLALLCDNFEMADREQGEDGGEEVQVEEQKEAMAQQIWLAPEEKQRKEEEEEEREEPKRDAEQKGRGFFPGFRRVLQRKSFRRFIHALYAVDCVLRASIWAPHPANPLRASIHGTPQWDYLSEAHWLSVAVAGAAIDALLAGEALLRMGGLGWQHALRTNKTNSALLLVSITTHILLAANVDVPALVRAAPSLRLLNIANAKVLRTLRQSLLSTSYALLLMLLSVLFFALLGMSLFGGFFPHPEHNYPSAALPAVRRNHAIEWDLPLPSRYHFDDLGTALLTCIIVLFGETWYDPAFDLHKATWGYYSRANAPFVVSLFFVTLNFTVNMVGFNLFIALLLSGFDDDDEEDEHEDEEEEEWQDVVPPAPQEPDETAPHSEPDASQPANVAEPMIEYRFGGFCECVEGEPPRPISPLESKPTATGKAHATGHCAALVSSPRFERIVFVVVLASVIVLAFDSPFHSEAETAYWVLYAAEAVLAACFTLEAVLRAMALGPKQYLRGHLLNVINAVIAILSLSPLGIAAGLRAFRVLRLIHLAVPATTGTLLRALPAALASFRVMFLLTAVAALVFLQLFRGRLGSCMDPRYAHLPHGSRIIPGMNGTQTDYEECMSLSRYNLTRRTSDGILLTEMADREPDASPSWLEFTEFPQWLAPQFGCFDNVLLAAKLAWEMAHLEGWQDVMHAAMATDPDEMYVEGVAFASPPLWRRPKEPWRLSSASAARGDFLGTAVGWVERLTQYPQQRIIAASVCILWMIFGCFVGMNMLIGGVVDTMSQIKAEKDGLFLMSEDAADWVKAVKELLLVLRPRVPPAQPTQWHRRIVHRVVTQPRFEWFMAAVVLSDILVGCAQHWEAAKNAPYFGQLQYALAIINAVFAAIYLAELVLKWAALGVSAYFREPFERLNCGLALLTLVDALVTFANLSTGAAAALHTACQALRPLRVFRLGRVSSFMRVVGITFMKSVPQLRGGFVLLVLILFFYNVLLVHYFSFVNFTPDRSSPAYHSEDFHWNAGTNWGENLDRHANFATFARGMLVVTTSFTGEAFNEVMYDLHGYEWGHNRLTCCPQCGPIVTPAPAANATKRTIPESSCGNSVGAFVLYVAFNLTLSIVSSFLVGVALENFANVGSQTRKIGLADLENFCNVWAQHDPRGTGIVHVRALIPILQTLQQPLGMAGSAPPLTASEALKHLGKLDVPYRGGFVTFHEVLLATANFHAGVPLPLCDTTKKMAHLANKAVASVAKKLVKPAHNALTALMVAGATGVNVAAIEKSDGRIPQAGKLDLSREQWVELCAQSHLPVEELAEGMALATFTDGQDSSRDQETSRDHKVRALVTQEL